MKNLVTALAFLATFLAKGQTNPNFDFNFETKWIKNENYTTIFYTVNDTIKTEIGRMNNTVQIEDGFITQSMILKSKMFKNDFIDITTCHATTLKPVFHSSFNDQRIITVAYNQGINAIYKSLNDDKIKTYFQPIKENISFIESSQYQNAVMWLPLKEGYSQKIKTFNYDPNSETGFSEVQIRKVSSENYQTEKSGLRSVWKVIVIYGSKESVSVHYIDKEDRKLWKTEVNGGKVLIIREE
ncbi:hypothetical protein LX77_01441 [Gelidibacter algens]|uniref:Uncharacterized protein n=1 Tax=Gelidibacter algens TaxID=49280 RepID=A0A1A7QNM7_9FLAO|nr:hypothetical protein [Gelidibacter algens]OBX20943.1 hypothetical protein A9996_18740 [Gelidibacter algens]RAJ25140.1 hypothetical protein LX77_01441 [Gelidibacter algens]